METITQSQFTQNKQYSRMSLIKTDIEESNPKASNDLSNLIIDLYSHNKIRWII